MDRSMKIQIGLALALFGMLTAAMWQAHLISQRLEVNDAEIRGQIQSANAARSGENAVLSAKFDALSDRVQYVTDDMRAQLADLKAEVKEIVKRNP